MKKFIVLIAASLLACFSCKENEKVDPGCAPISLSVTSESPSCKATNGSINVAVTSGNEGVQFSLDGSNFQTAALFSNLAAGSYVVTVRDKDNCVETKTVELSETNTIQLALSATNAGCGGSNGSLTAMSSGGEGGFTYSIDEGSFQSSPDFTGLSSKNYRVTAKDANGCLKVETARVPSGISYATEVKTIIETSCAKSGCHVQGGQSPNFSLFSNVKSNAGRIKTLTGNGTMPKDGTLSAEQIQKIACWVDDGALDN